MIKLVEHKVCFIITASFLICLFLILDFREGAARRRRISKRGYLIYSIIKDIIVILFVQRMELRRIKKLRLYRSIVRRGRIEGI